MGTMHHGPKHLVDQTKPTIQIGTQQMQQDMLFQVGSAQMTPEYLEYMQTGIIGYSGIGQQMISNPVVVNPRPVTIIQVAEKDLRIRRAHNGLSRRVKEVGTDVIELHDEIQLIKKQLDLVDKQFDIHSMLQTEVAAVLCKQQNTIEDVKNTKPNVSEIHRLETKTVEYVLDKKLVIINVILIILNCVLLFKQ